MPNSGVNDSQTFTYGCLFPMLFMTFHVTWHVLKMNTEVLHNLTSAEYEWCLH
jgi:hypothetical protein